MCPGFWVHIKHHCPSGFLIIAPSYYLGNVTVLSSVFGTFVRLRTDDKAIAFVISVLLKTVTAASGFS